MSDLRGTGAPGRIDTGNRAKIIGALLVAAMVTAAGTYSYEAGLWRAPANPVVANGELPAPDNSAN
jgi:hypothetical protein